MCKHGAYRQPWFVGTPLLGTETVARSQEGERDSQAETKSCGASTIPAEGERNELRNGASPECCLTSAEISQSHKNPLNQRMPLNKETFLSSLSVRNQTKLIARSMGVTATVSVSLVSVFVIFSVFLFFLILK